MLATCEGPAIVEMVFMSNVSGFAEQMDQILKGGDLKVIFHLYFLRNVSEIKKNVKLMLFSVV